MNAQAAAKRPSTAPDPWRVIEELVYERVRLDADRVAMDDLDRDLALSFRRALTEVRASSEELCRGLDAAVDRAFVRVAAELVEDAGDDSGCPLCDRPVSSG